MKKRELSCQGLSRILNRNESVHDRFQRCRRARPHAGESFAENRQFTDQPAGRVWAEFGFVGPRIAGDAHEFVRLRKKAKASLIEPEANQDLEMLSPACAFETLVGS